jgi:hypothetical protein
LEFVSPDNFLPIVEIKKKKYKINTFNYGEFPSVESNNKLPTIFIINKDYQNFFICGVANLNILNDAKNHKMINTGLTKSINNNASFIGFNFLTSINKII